MRTSYLEVLRRYRAEGKKPLRTIHLTWVPGKFTHDLVGNLDRKPKKKKNWTPVTGAEIRVR